MGSNIRSLHFILKNKILSLFTYILYNILFGYTVDLFSIWNIFEMFTTHVIFKTSKFMIFSSDIKLAKI